MVQTRPELSQTYILGCLLKKINFRYCTSWNLNILGQYTPTDNWHASNCFVHKSHAPGMTLGEHYSMKIQNKVKDNYKQIETHDSLHVYTYCRPNSCHLILSSLVIQTKRFNR